VNTSTQYALSGDTADEIAASVEEAVRGGDLPPGATLPTVRALAAELAVSPTTVAASYRELTRRGIVAGEGRRGTRVRAAPPISGRLPLAVPAGVLDLRTGGPDPALLPVLPARSNVEKASRPYGQSPVSGRLASVARVKLAAEGIDASNIAVVGGALDGVERVLGAWLRPGDRVAVEDPGYTAVLDLLAALGLRAVPIGMDEQGVVPDQLAAALDKGVSAVVLTPRAQNPTGAAWDESRAGELSAVLRRYGDVFVVEDDHAGPAAGAALNTVCGDLVRWATIRSVSKWLGPDLRLAVLAGDPVTVGRVEGRQALGPGWVSYLLQETVASMWTSARTARQLDKAASIYAARRKAIAGALCAEGIVATTRSGLTAWVAVPDEHAVVSGLSEEGIAVSPGERFRIQSGPGVRLAIAALEERDAPGVAVAFARVLHRRSVRAG
jgi:DNA-binding transcriptional MocR family regulator